MNVIPKISKNLLNLIFFCDLCYVKNPHKQIFLGPLKHTLFVSLSEFLKHLTGLRTIIQKLLNGDHFYFLMDEQVFSQRVYRRYYKTTWK